MLLVALVMVVLAASCSSGSSTGDEEGPSSSSVTDVSLVQANDTSLLEVVRARGVLICGVSGAAVGFSMAQPDGTHTGIDADMCRAIASAVLGDALAVRFEPVTADQGVDAIRTGAVDVLLRHAEATLEVDAARRLDFGPTTYFDGQQVLGRAPTVDRTSGVDALANSRVCVGEPNSAAALAGANVEVVVLEDLDVAMEQFMTGECEFVSASGIDLIARRVDQRPEGEEWVIFPPAPLTRQPRGPVYGHNDSEFADVINWTIFATVIADIHGVTSANLDEALQSGPPEIQRLLGGEGELQSALGLSPSAFYDVIDQVGNYDEVFARNLGPLGVVRADGPNALWRDGGLVYAPRAR